MCGRFTIMIQPEQLQLELNLGLISPSLIFMKDFYPGSGIPVVIDAEKRNVEVFYWGLVPSWAKDISISRKMFNARSETLLEKPSYRTSFLRRRCLIPASGFYEWKRSDGKKIPYYFSVKNENTFTFAGLWEYWMDASGNELYSATIITCAANPLIQAYHDRMPVILDQENRWKWMEDRPVKELSSFLRPYESDQMQIQMVHTD